MKTAIEKQRGKWVVRFTQGSQTFTLFHPESGKDKAEWQKEMLDFCFDNFRREVRAEKIEVEKEIDDITASVIQHTIIEEMDFNMADSGMAQDEIDKCLTHWNNKYLITRK